MMSRLSSERVKTFSIGFKEQQHNELPYAKMIAEKYDTEHYEFIVESELIEILPSLIWHYEEPYADSSQLPTFYVSKMTRNYVTVALNGDGGDENFAGYARYEAIKRINALSKLLPKGVWSKIVIPIIKFLFPLVPSRFSRPVKMACRTLPTDLISQYAELISYFGNEDKASLLTDDFLARVEVGKDSYDTIRDVYANSLAEKPLDRLLYTDFNTYVPDDLMVKVDIVSMANSLECRSPLLDRDFVEFTDGIAPELKMKGYDKKYVFKKALRGIVPDEILYRKKSGFGLPIGDWFRGTLKDYVRSIILSEKAVGRGYFHKSYVEKLVNDHENGKYDYSRMIWALLTFEMWHNRFIDA